MRTTLAALTTAGLLVVTGCVPAPEAAQCKKTLTQAAQIFARLDTNKDRKISRSEWHVVEEMFAQHSAQFQRKYGAPSDPTTGEQEFRQIDKDGGEYLTFDEFTDGLCKNGRLPDWPPPLPNDHV